MPKQWHPPILCGLVLVTACDLDPEPVVFVDAPDHAVVAAPFEATVTATDDDLLVSVMVAWGDGTADTAFVGTAHTEMDFTHAYGLGGPFTIQVTATDRGGQRATATAELVAVPASVAVTPVDESIHEIGDTLALVATVLDAAGAPLANPETEWATLDAHIATVSGAGVVTAAASGTARIVATSWGVADTASVLVSLAPVITAAGESQAVVAAEYALGLAVTGDNALTGVTVDWGDGSEPVETELDGTSAEVTVSHTYTQAGEFAIQVTATDAMALVGDRVVELLVVPAGVAVAPDTINAIGFTRGLVAAVLDAQGEPVPNPATTWSALDSQIATVDTAGVVTAVAVGTARIVATSWTVADTADVLVRQVPGHIEVTATDSLMVRGRGAATAEVQDSNHVVIPGADVTWSTSTPDILAVDDDGGLTGLAEGTGIVVAAAGPLSDSTELDLAIGMLFASWGNEGNDIFLVTRHGTLRQNLTQQIYADRDGAWSPDGQWIVFASGGVTAGRLAIMDADGENRSELETGVSSAFTPAWSPDGTRIAFTGGDQSFYYDIHIVNVDGSGLVAVTSDTTLDDRSPRWSPDGTRLLFERDSGPQPGIYVVDADGSNLVWLGNGFTPAWSPDGSEIAFARHSNEVAHGFPVIHLMDADGSNVRRIGEHWAINLDWSPDGLWFAFVTSVDDELDGDRDIFVMSADGGEPIRITHDAASEHGLRWRP